MLEEIYADGGVEDARVVFLGEDAETRAVCARAIRIARAPSTCSRKPRDCNPWTGEDVVAELATPPLDGIEALGGVASTATRVLALDGIQDPGNLGTLTRTAPRSGGTPSPIFRERATRSTIRYVSRRVTHASFLVTPTCARRKTRGVVSLRFALARSRSFGRNRAVPRAPCARVSSPPRAAPSWEELETDNLARPGAVLRRAHRVGRRRRGRRLR